MSRLLQAIGLALIPLALALALASFASLVQMLSIAVAGLIVFGVGRCMRYAP